MPHWWIVINYHQVELSGWCNTGLGISHPTAMLNFLRFSRSVLAVDKGRQISDRMTLQDCSMWKKQHHTTLNIVGQLKIVSALKKALWFFMTGAPFPECLLILSLSGTIHVCSWIFQADVACIHILCRLLYVSYSDRPVCSAPQFPLHTQWEWNLLLSLTGQLYKTVTVLSKCVLLILSQVDAGRWTTLRKRM